MLLAGEFLTSRRNLTASSVRSCLVSEASIASMRDDISAVSWSIIGSGRRGIG